MNKSLSEKEPTAHVSFLCPSSQCFFDLSDERWRGGLLSSTQAHNNDWETEGRLPYFGCASIQSVNIPFPVLLHGIVHCGAVNGGAQERRRFR